VQKVLVKYFVLTLVSAGACTPIHGGAMSTEPIARQLIFDHRAPNPRVWAAILELFDKTPEIKYHADPRSGIVVTDWYKTHKGEVELRMEAGVNGDYVRFEGWHKVGFLRSPDKTDWSRRVEESFQRGLEILLKEPKYAPAQVEMTVMGEGKEVTTSIPMEHKLAVHVKSNRHVWVALYSTNSAGYPNKIAGVQEVKANTELVVTDEAGKPLVLGMPQFNLGLGLVVYYSPESVKVHAGKIKDWSQMEVDKQFDVAD
jgi:hypothetical protein